ncbi:hypothetical protein NL676_007132, partial [Syzygium grande]
NTCRQTARHPTHPFRVDHESASGETSRSGGSFLPMTDGGWYISAKSRGEMGFPGLVDGRSKGGKAHGGTWWLAQRNLLVTSRRQVISFRAEDRW